MSEPTDSVVEKMDEVENFVNEVCKVLDAIPPLPASVYGFIPSTNSVWVEVRVAPFCHEWMNPNGEFETPP